LTLGLAAALLIPVTVYGWEGNYTLLQAWARTLTESTAPNLLNQDNVSIWAMYAKWGGSPETAARLATMTIAVLGGTFLIVLWKGLGISRADYLEMALLLLLIPLCSPQGWDYVLLTSTPAVMLLINELPDMPRPVGALAAAALAIMAFSVFDV